jgi:hypothetical protein
MEAENVPFSDRKVAFLAENVPFQRRYFILGFDLACRKCQGGQRFNHKNWVQFFTCKSSKERQPFLNTTIGVCIFLQVQLTTASLKHNIAGVIFFLFSIVKTDT